MQKMLIQRADSEPSRRWRNSISAAGDLAEASITGSDMSAADLTRIFVVVATSRNGPQRSHKSQPSAARSQGPNTGLFPVLIM